MEAESQGSDPGGVAALELKGNFMFDPAKHGDFLGAILGTGQVGMPMGFTMNCSSLWLWLKQ